jgi:hypothetical protein
MAINLLRCPVLGANVTAMIDLGGEATKIICAEYDARTGVCRLKTSAAQGGMLSQLLERVSADTLDTRDTRCFLS